MGDAEGEGNEQSLVLLPSAIQAYITLTKGLSCLCKWPLVFPQRIWDAMMKSAASICHHWIAHVMPLYALLFPKSCGKVTKFILKVRNDLPLVDSSMKPMDQHLQGSDHRSCAVSNNLGVLRVVHGTCIPYVKSLSAEYKKLYGIDLVAAFESNSGSSSNSSLKRRKGSAEAAVGAWILTWTHMLAAAAQLRSAARFAVCVCATSHCDALSD